MSVIDPLAGQTETRRDLWWALGLGLAALALYLATLAPSVATVFDDSLEFQVVLPSLGIAHPTGYPLYTLLGWLLSRLPVGDLAYRVNLLSALAGAAAVAVMFLVARRLGSARLPAALMVAVFALSATWWSQATIAEVYTLHGLAVALILYLTLSDRGTRTPWLALVFGLALAHHRTTLLLAPGVLVYLLWTDPGVLRRPRDLVKLALAFLLPLALYLYLPLRGQSVASLDGAVIDGWDSFWRHVLASDYGSFLSANPLAVQRPASYPLRLLLSQMGLAALLLGAVGWLRWPQQPQRWTMLALVLGANLLFAIGYKTADVDVLYLPITMAWLLVASAGLSWLLDRLAAWLESLDLRSGPVWQVILTGLLAMVVLLQPLLTTARTLESAARPQTCAEVLAVGETPAFTPKRSEAWNALNCGLAMLDQDFPPQSTVVGLQGEITLLRYLQLDRGLRPDVRLIDADREDERLAVVEAELAAGRAVFVTRELPGGRRDRGAPVGPKSCPCVWRCAAPGGFRAAPDTGPRRAVAAPERCLSRNRCCGRRVEGLGAAVGAGWRGGCVYRCCAGTLDLPDPRLARRRDRAGRLRLCATRKHGYCRAHAAADRLSRC